MGSFQVWTSILIFYQTVLCVLLGWCTLDCKFSPTRSELQEVTLVKLLYLYDPQACGRVYFYNVTTRSARKRTISSVMWPVTNEVAANFRRKTSFWMSLHIVWFILSIVNIMYGSRSCGFYVALLPFTLTGLALLVVDLIYMTLFLQDLRYTKTELSILTYINSDENLKSLNEYWCEGQMSEDTSWISLLFAYISCRGVVQWLINFWLVKDNYFNGLAVYRIVQKEKHRNKQRA